MNPRASLARLATLAECMEVRLVSLDLRLPEDGDVAALKRKLAEAKQIVNMLAGKS